MQTRAKATLALAIGVLLAGGLAVEILTSTGPSGPCAGIITPSSPSGASTAVPHALSNELGSGSRAETIPRTAAAPGNSSSPILVVAAENFWGSLVSQLGGNQTSVTSIVTDPNTDPHEYEANPAVAKAISDAQFVIVNGVGYDQWAIDIVQSDGNLNQVILNVGDLNGVSVTGGIVNGNPHMWYNPAYVNATVAAMYSDLVSLRPSATAYFQAQYTALNVSLGQLYGEATAIGAQFAGTVVAATESIFVYLANFTHLDLVSPTSFMQAVADGNDPPPESVVVFQCQLESGHVAVLVFNNQTVTPITDSMKSLAASNHVPTVGITETIQPPSDSFEVWMGAQYLALYNALNAKALGP